jgi:hypothetical protein
MKKYTTKIVIVLISLLILIAIGMKILINNIMTVAPVANSTPTISQNNSSANYSNFDSIIISGSGNVSIKEGAFKVTLNTLPNIHPELHQDGNMLTIKGLAAKNSLIIQMPKLKSVTTEGMVHVDINGFRNLAAPQEIFTLNTAGASAIKVANSELRNIALHTAGAASIDFESCVLEAVNLDLSGSSNINLNTFVNGTLSGKASGFADIQYSGNLTNKLKYSGSVSIMQSSN